MSIRAFGRNRRNAKSDGVDNTVSPMDRKRTSNTLPTLDQSQRAAAKGSGVSPPCIAFVSITRSCGEESTMSRRPFMGSFFDRRFVDEHHGNVVADGINALALDAFQRAFVRFQLDFRFAGRTREYFQEFLTNCHGMTFLCGAQCGNAESLPYLLRRNQCGNTDQNQNVTRVCTAIRLPTSRRLFRTTPAPMGALEQPSREADDRRCGCAFRR